MYSYGANCQNYHLMTPFLSLNVTKDSWSPNFCFLSPSTLLRTVVMWSTPLYAVDVLLSSVNKEIDLNNSQTELSQGGNLNRETGEKKQS